MMKKALLLTVIGFGLIGFGCQQSGDYFAQRQRPQPQQQEYVEYSEWRGPGWYSGVWFNNEGAYITWRNRRQGYYTSRPYYYRTYPRNYDRRGWGIRWRWGDRRDRREDRRERRRDRREDRRERRRDRMREQRERVRENRSAQRQRQRQQMKNLQERTRRDKAAQQRLRKGNP